MANAATETPAAYLLAARFHEHVRAMIDAMDHDHDFLAIELLKYSERILGNVGAAEAPFAADRRQEHYQIAFGAICGCASACDIVRRLRMTPREHADGAARALASLAAIVRPIAEEGMPARDPTERAILDDMFDNLEADEPWKDPAADGWDWGAGEDWGRGAGPEADDDDGDDDGDEDDR